MSISKRFKFKSRTFEVGEFQSAVVGLLSRFHPEGQPPDISISQELPDGSRSNQNVHDPSSLENICDFAIWTIDLRFRDGTYGYNSISFSSYQDFITIQIYSDTAEQVRNVHDLLVNALHLEQHVPVSSDSEEPTQAQLNENIITRLDMLERKVLSPSRMRCFLSYRFSTGTEPLALRLQQFLSLLDIEVLTGASYEPRRISEKVLSKLNAELDFIVLLVTNEGESLWTRDEVASAVQKKLAVIPIVEDGATFEPGLFGDIEFIPFSHSHVGDAFLKVLEAVVFLRKQLTGAREALNQDSVT